MKLEITLLRTRVARRMLLLFLLCALVPIVTLAAIIYPVVVDRVEVARLAQLHDDAKGAGMLMLARFERLAGMLRWGEVPADSTGAGSQFSGVAIEEAGGAVRLVSGQTGPLPALDSARSARLAAGNPVLVVSRSSGMAHVFLVVTSEGASGSYPRTWGSLTVSAAIAGLDLVREGIALCVADHQGPLACNTSTDSAQAGGVQLARQWPMFLKSEFGAPAWTITATQRRSDALASLAEFRRTFVLGLVFALILVFVLSHVQIRRRMTPLADLEAGARRLQSGDFSSRVVIQSGDEFQSLGTAFNQMAKDLERQFTTLSALHSIDHAALQDHSTGAIAVAALHGAPELLGADVVALATAGPADTTAWRLDLVTPQEPNARLADIELSAQDVLGLGHIGTHLVIGEHDARPGYCGALGDHGCRELILFPILGQRGPIGVLMVGSRAATGSHDGMVATGRQLAEQLALGLSNVSLLEELDSLSLGALTALARTIDASSPWTAGHSERVTRYAVAIAESLGFAGPDILRLRQGSLLHDIGKIGVPPAILDKPGPLSEAELVVMQSHPATGARIVESVRAFRDLVPLVLHHHELLDGSGYPAGLQGDEIPEIVRVLTVADVFDALTSDRPYRKGLAADAALAILTKGVGTKFDIRAVAALVELVAADVASGTLVKELENSLLTPRDEQMLVGATRPGRAA